MTKYDSNPLVSIIVTVYNKGNHIEDTLLSAINQKYKELEIIVVNDGSNDNSLDIIKKVTSIDTRVKFIDQNNMGPSLARNNGFKIAKGKYINFLDGDDLLLEDFLLECVSILESNTKIDIVHTSWIKVDQFGKLISSHTAPKPEDYLKELLLGNLFATHAVLAREEILREVGEMLAIKTEDWEYWARCAQKGAQFLDVNKVLAITKDVPNSDQKQLRDLERIGSEAIEILFNREMQPKYKRLQQLSIIRNKLFILEYLKSKISEEDRCTFVLKLVEIIKNTRFCREDSKYLLPMTNILTSKQCMVCFLPIIRNMDVNKREKYFIFYYLLKNLFRTKLSLYLKKMKLKK